MTRHLVFIHGRSQQGQPADQLKQAWINAWKAGLDAAGLNFPIAETSIHFPYYGDTLAALDAGSSNPPDVIVRGSGSAPELAFVASVMRELQARYGVTDAAIADALGGAIQRDWFNNRWIQKALELLDKKLPGGSALTMYVATHDVHKYITNPGVRDFIDSGVREAMAKAEGEETVVVAHSLGTVVGYNVFRSADTAGGWSVPLYVTLGSPLGVQAVHDALVPIKRPPFLGAWFNAMDPDDVVSLHELTAVDYPFEPPIENKTDVKNETPNRHGISGYLSDPEVASRIHSALTAT